MKHSKYKRLLPLSSALVLQSISVLAQQNSQRPNIIFIMSDDHASKAISCYDGSINRTPNIDRIAQNGVRFTNCFCTNAVSGPSRAVILTGQMSNINGMTSNEVVFDSANLTLPKVLRANGYQTAIVGKWHLKSNPTGFDFWKIMPGQGEYFNPVFVENGKKVTEQGYITDLITDESIEWMSQRDTTKPFFIMIHNKAPHRPWLPKFENIGMYDTANIPVPLNFFDDFSNRTDAAKSQKMSIYKDMQLDYDLKVPDSISENFYTDAGRLSKSDRAIWDSIYAIRNHNFLEKPLEGKELAEWKYRRYMSDYLSVIKTVDDNVGKVLDYLKANGLLENTIIVYTSDQGFFLGEHGWFDKRFMYDESYRMPLLIQYPAKFKGGKVNDQMLMNVDFAPTFLDWAGIKKPEQMQGESFARYIDTTARLRNATYYHYYEYPGEHSVKRHYGIRTENYKLIHFYYDVDQWELFDLKKDPHEMINVYGKPEYQSIQAELKNELEKMQLKYQDTSLVVPANNLKISNKAQGLSYSLIIPSNLANPKYMTSLTDGIIENPKSTLSNFKDNWIGFQGIDFETTLSTVDIKEMKEVEIRFLNLPESWIFEPTSIEFYVKTKNGKTQKIENISVTNENRAMGGTVVHYKIKLTTKNIDEIKIKATNPKVCPTGHPGEGKPAWIFTDEIIIR